MKNFKIQIIVVALTISGTLFAQAPLYQVVKGLVRDKDSQSPLTGATVIVENTDPVLGTTTGLNGEFKLEKVPVGRQTIRVSFIGYEPYIIRELLVTSGKEIVLTVELKELATEIEGVTVTAHSDKEQPINSMASVSARQLSVEEANRYAGGFDDPARLATSFAGVAGSLQNNGIVIRGNSPKGLLWKLEGVEISTPSHFANITTFGGGGITALSSQMLANSDFYTGAFPAEYGNALSGVFDMKLRTGNTDKTEFTAQVGAIGLDVSMEGPLIKGKKASYLFNYRYSTFSLLGPFLPADASGIRYQDLCFKINVPLKKAGVFSLWGIGALDKNPQHAETDSSKWLYMQDMEEGKNDLGMGGLGINHKIILGTKSYLHTSLSVSGNGLSHKQWRMNEEVILQPLENVEFYNWKYTLSSFINLKFSNKHTNRTGFILDQLHYNILIQHANIIGNPFSTIANDDASAYLLQYFTESKYILSKKISFTAGLHGQYFGLTGKHSLEPRTSISWQAAPSHKISFGYGNYSQLEMIQFYLVRKQTSSGFTYPNKHLDFSKAEHFVFSYDYSINRNLRFKAEPYYETLSSIPVIPDSSFSMLNLDKNWFISDSLINKGTGKNYGVDLTLEHFLDKGFYYLITVSLFNSKYKGGDGVERNTRYNRHYVANIITGKEWMTKHSNIFSVNMRLNFMGGERISPLNTQASLAEKEAVYNEYNAFSQSKPNVWYADLTVNYKINKHGHSSTWSLKMINLLAAKEFNGYRYNFKTNSMEKEEEAIIIPNLSYKIEF